MKFITAAALTSLVALASAQFPGLPACAQDCATNSIPKNCGIDVKCICSATSFLDAITCCVAQKCSTSEQEATIKFANGICGTAGVTNLPQSAVCSTAPTPSGSSSSSSSPTASRSTSATSGSASSSALSTAAASSSPRPSSTSNAAVSNNANGGAIAAIAGLLVALA
ncbi:hypothetical protein LOZ12_003457 [Ophidiomyces ophidiicola]|uniref:uncharacterized protein n=1 Tax=Ophidiomyces ophidiicola TaxID=1387563 RepID=UPI0020C58302|nr:uncharacterized protein LOZ57_006346 [Ophidiomyces ophidiicola]KAI1938384.1 hypothetical protein LOZ57_006346 [Ophidiomyces ophidiicola]KAI1945060.1 hypothetical protein LOZ62_003926 [Ophidiomyces ophidiicola]KAI1949455.1 hypothetical protein LOZ59_006100 [Ophidiomyces ophidiicola]KAI1966289.1 hypothetical protein LOZ56_005866 [Ophidiomyces ophidiicola]KAI2005399.1 hypothetical protein LOZ50_003745 [Ophidiomyces ophidiicola]